MQYFLWNRDYEGNCEVSSVFQNQVLSTANRPLLEKGVDIFIRYNEAISILKKIVSVLGGTDAEVILPELMRFSSLVSSRKPFGMATNHRVYEEEIPDAYPTYWNGGAGYKNSGFGWVPKAEVTAGSNLIDTWKVFIGAAYGDRGGGGNSRDTPPKAVLSRPFLGKPGEISTETYNCIGPFADETEARNVMSYISTKFFRFLVLLAKPSQHATSKVYSFAPILDFREPWSDEKLNEFFGLDEEETQFIDWMIRPMELD